MVLPMTTTKAAVITNRKAATNGAEVRFTMAKRKVARGKGSGSPWAP
jgi:hypothetical protein